MKPLTLGAGQSSNEPVKNGCDMIHEMFHILNCRFEIKYAMIKQLCYKNSSSEKCLKCIVLG